MVLKEVIAYYMAHGGSVYCPLLDATKAFDCVEYYNLFNIVCFAVISHVRLLMNMYTNHVTRVSWNGICSSPFVVDNGIKPGGVTSPIMFCIYIDGLLGVHKNSAFGCWLCVSWGCGLCWWHCAACPYSRNHETKCWPFVIAMLMICTLSSMLRNPSVYM